MKYIRLNTTDPYYNLALEEYLFKTAEDDVFMLWQNGPSVIAGKNQNVYAEVDLDYAKKEGINVCRRITGGGAVYHDLGNINYTFISPRGVSSLNFEYFTRPIRSALLGLGIESTLGGRNDIECRGSKISGNAQHVEGGRILHHGTLLFDTDSSVMSRVLKVDKEKLAYRAVKSCSARVVNLCGLFEHKISLDEFIYQIESRVCADLGAVRTAPPECEEINALYERNRSEEWIYSKRRYLTDYSVIRKKKFPFGLVIAELTLERELIKNIRISGDFFSTRPIDELEAALVGTSPNMPPDIDPSPFIDGMSRDELSLLLSGV